MLKKILFPIISIMVLMMTTNTHAKKINVLIWSERTEPEKIYPNGINGAIADFLSMHQDLTVKTSNLSDAGYGLSNEALDQTDVLIWFGHKHHDEVPDEVAQRVKKHVEENGMVLIPLHSSHFSKPFKLLMGQSGAWKDYRETGEPEEIKVKQFGHPIAKGLEDFTVPQTEVYEEPFDVPTPDDIILTGHWPQSNLSSREVMTWRKGLGQVIYIRFGHEDYPIFFMPQMQKLITNAVYWGVEESKKMQKANA